VTDALLVDRAGGVATLTLNRPDSLNSLDTATKEALRDTLADVGADPAIRAVVLTGAGRAFCVGQDLREHVQNLESAEKLSTVREHYNPIVRTITEMPKPVIAAVRGMAAGAGASLAFVCDFRVGGPKTAFLLAFANVGLAADTGASWTLPHLVGRAKALELLMLAQPIDAATSERLGLLTQLVDNDEDVITKAQEFAEKLANGPTFAYGQIKRQLLATGTLEESLEVEAVTQALCGETEDHKNATAAFVKKEKPVFEGR
jgi:2-(1,2-epoxy-1,2-dihydrophenyl)acetyl-CoA isomerase